MWPAENLRQGCFLAFERDREQPFRLVPVRGEEYGQRAVDLVWGQVTRLCRLGNGGRERRPPLFLLAVCCSFDADACLITTLFNHSPVLLRPPAAGW
ncbi:hypothetical protein [Streptosporangium sp. CA-115845]|uniref:hypothetical protein n=1 Tax=Streptosporangium sp. CA-115845 TaxID=3240071 RepID=UPI003D8ABF15